MLIEEGFNSAELDYLCGDRIFLKVAGCPKDLVVDGEVISDACSAICLVANLLAGDSLLSSEVDGGHRFSSFGKRFLRDSKKDYAYIVDGFSGARQHPYIAAFGVITRLLNSGLMPIGFPWKCSNDDIVMVEKALRAEIDSALGIEKLRKVARANGRSVRKNLKSYRSYVDGLFICHPDARPICVDLRYKYNNFGRPDNRLNADLVRSDLGIFVSDLRQVFNSGELYGYIWKLEFGLFDNFYARAIFFVNLSAVSDFEVYLRNESEKYQERPESDFGAYMEFFEPVTGSHGFMCRDEDFDRAEISGLKDKVSMLIRSELIFKVDLGPRARSIGRAISCW
jgi:hypothetical protein